jgi:hypothetical protein
LVVRTNSRWPDRRILLRCAGWSLVWAASAFGQKKPKETVSVALIAGSVFREPGFSLPGAEIELQPDPEGKTSNKVKKMKVVSDRRGEFNFRVPPVPMRYSVTVRAAGFQAETRQVTISGEERQDVFVTLKAAKEASK